MKLTFKNSKIISESEKAYSIVNSYCKVINIPKSQIINIEKTERETTFTLTKWIFNKLTN